MLFTFYRIIKFAFQGFFRNIWLSLITVSVIILAFISINFIISLNIISSSAVNLVQNRVDVSVYFKSDTDESIILEAKNSFSELSQVENIDYISKEEALDSFRKSHKDDISVLESLEELEGNPLMGTLKIKAKDVNEYPLILDFINNSKYDSYILDKNFDDHKVFINSIGTISKNITKFGIAASIIFALISILIVFNTIKLTIYSQREEIAIMRLVGANNYFISSPFICESVLYTIFAFIGALLILFPASNFIQPYLASYFNESIVNLRQYFFDNLWLIFGSEFMGMIFLNSLASIIAVRKYLKV